jgi:hypothetical protein
MTSRPPDLELAIHESGHVVVAFACGLAVARVSLVEAGRSWARATVQSDAVRATRDLERQLMVDVAGACAESVVFRRPWRATEIGQVDIIRAADTAAAAFRCHRAMTTVYLERAADRCLAFLAQRVPRRALEHLASELLARQELDGAELRELFTHAGLRAGLLP